jgi:hypothetical protein
MRILLAFLFSLALAAQAAAQVPDATDAEVKKGIEINWNRMTANLLLGERLVEKDAAPGTCTSETMNLAQYEFLLGAQKTGYVKISYWKDQDFAGDKEYSYEEMLARASAGKVKKFTITPTRRAARWKTADISITGRTGCLSFRVGEYEIGKVLRNEPHQKGGKDFRTVSLTYRVMYYPMMLDIREANNIKWTPDRKANVLIQYNTEKKNWDVATLDHADANAEIKTTNIADYLAKLN